MCFVWISEQTAIISMYSTDWLVFITETECVYCAVRTGSLYVILAKVRIQKGCAVAQAVNRRLLIADARVRSQASLCEICGGQSGPVAGFSPSSSVFLCQYHSSHAPIHIYLLLTAEGQTGEPSKQNKAVSEIGKHSMDKQFYIFRI